MRRRLKRIALFISVSVAVAAISIANVLDFLLSHLMDPANHDRVVFGSVIAVLLLFAALVWLVLRANISNGTFAIALGAMVLVGFVPRGVDAIERRINEGQRAAELAHVQGAFLAELAARQKDVAGRIAARHPFSGEEAAAFVAFVQGADLTWTSLPDYSNAALPLLERSLQAKILDPNSLRTRGAQSVPVFVDFYNRDIRPTKSAIRLRDWKILELLVANGADLSIAKELSADLARKQIIGPAGFMRLE